MKIKFVSLLLMFILASGHSSIIWAQTTSANDWSSVQAIGINEPLVVKAKDGKEISGKMIEATDQSLTIDRKGKPLMIPRSEVREIYRVRGKAAKGKWALIGAGAGAAAGTGIGATKYSPHRDDSEIWLGMGLLIGTGAGAVTGLLFGQSRQKRELIYSAQ